MFHVKILRNPEIEGGRDSLGIWEGAFEVYPLRPCIQFWVLLTSDTDPETRIWDGRNCQRAPSCLTGWLSAGGYMRVSLIADL